MVANTPVLNPQINEGQQQKAVERLRISAGWFISTCRNIDCRIALTGSPGFIILLYWCS